MKDAPVIRESATQTTEGPAIVFDNVTVGFGERDILRGISFAVQSRETLVLLGETGTGKTLLMKLAAGLLQPDRGSIEVLGKPISQMSELDLLEFRRHVGFVFQEGALFDSLTVGENVAYRLIEDDETEEQYLPKVQEALRFVELENTVDMLPSELSGGMRRRVSIARALVTQPPVVLYDSPTAGLDPVTSQTIISLILRLRDVFGVTALLATHRVQDGFGLANFFFDPKSKHVRRDVTEATAGSVTRFLVLRDGRIYFQGTPEEFLHSNDQYLQRFLI